ncbi:MAG: EamA family transporter [Pseudomonadota bacterium]
MDRTAILLVAGALISWSLLLVVSRVILLTLALDPWLFTFIQMMAGGAALLVLSGAEADLRASLRDPVLWLYGVLRVLTAAFFTAALLHTTAANAAFISILSVPTSVALLWLLLARVPRAWEAPGHLLIIAGLVGLTTTLEGGVRNPALLLMILSELCVVTSTLIAELHPRNQTEDRRARAALTGAMLLISAFVMLITAVGLSAAVQAMPSLAAVLPIGATVLSDPTRVLDPALWGAAIAVGILLRGPSMCLALAAIHRVGTTNYLAGLAVLPLSSLVFEAAASAAGLIPPVTVWTLATAFGTVMVVGSLAVIAARARAG